MNPRTIALLASLLPCLAVGEPAPLPTPLPAPASVPAPALAAAARPDTLHFTADPKGIEAIELVQQAQVLLGGAWFFDPKDLKDTRIYLAGDIDVAADRFLPFFEQCLSYADLLHLELRGVTPLGHRIMKLGQQARGQQALKTFAAVIEPAELPQLAERHTLVTTTLQPRNLPARELVTTLNLYFADSATESIRNIEGTNFILMTGFSDHLARYAEMAQRLEAAASADPLQGQALATARELQKRLSSLENQVAQLREQLAAAEKR